MDAILLQLLNGLDKGGAYALIALGLTLIFGTLGVVNFAHGALFMLGAFCAVALNKLMTMSVLVKDPAITFFDAYKEVPYLELWFGGIGTYIKASHQTNAQVGDPANDPLRVDASEIRAKVIGEGANLAINQAARIEFASLGGRINTDFIDNSAGVDCSDNEVNIKIPLNREMRNGQL